MVAATDTIWSSLCASCFPLLLWAGPPMWKVVLLQNMDTRIELCQKQWTNGLCSFAWPVPCPLCHPKDFCNQCSDIATAQHNGCICCSQERCLFYSRARLRLRFYLQRFSLQLAVAANHTHSASSWKAVRLKCFYYQPSSFVSMAPLLNHSMLAPFLIHRSLFTAVFASPFYMMRSHLFLQF